MLNEFYKIGQVIKVSGQKILVRVFESRNSHVLVYQGNIIKNVSVGSYIKIPKGYNNIIGVIEGEYIQENNLSFRANNHRFSNESEDIDRIIEVSVMGVLSNNRFIRGLVDIPLVFSDAYILMDDEVRQIFDFSGDNNSAIPIGIINDYKEETLNVNVSSLFASHIGIFGNTGSGKSNTLAKIYTECFERFANRGLMERSKFIVIDFNGEYQDAFTNKKKTYLLSTRNDEGDRIPIDRNFLKDAEVWAIICEATEKTQKPFLGRAISTYTRISEAEERYLYIKKLLCKLMEEYLEEPVLFIEHLRYFKQIIELCSNTYEMSFEILDSIQVRNYGKTFYRKTSDKEYWADSINTYRKDFVSPALDPLFEDNNRKRLDEYSLFEFAILYRFLEEVSRHIIVEEHIAPLIARFMSRTKNVKRLFGIEKQPGLSWLSIVSLADVNIEFKKIAPLIICKYYYEKHKKAFLNTKGSLHIIIDEAHNVLSTMSERESQTWKDYRLETFEEIIKEGRKFGVFLTISSQRPSDISETIISQLHNYFIHRLVNNEDIRAIGKAVSFIDKNSYEMISVLPQGACIFTGVASNFPVLIQVDLLPEQFQPHSSTIDLIKLWNS